MIKWKKATKDDLLIIAKGLSGIPEHNEGEKDEKQAFDCRACGERYIPYKGQWIFYRLCDSCFAQFNPLKMASRFHQISERFDTPDESGVDAWIKYRQRLAR